MFEINVEQKDQYVYIHNMQYYVFKRDVKIKLKSFYISKLFSNVNILGTLQIHKFFLPEFVYVLSQLPTRNQYIKIKELIFEKTWMKQTIENYSSRVKMNKIDSEMSYTLKPYQREFVELYDNKKQKYNLNGYLLSFEQGLGKTFTSLALMHGLDKDAVVIIAPKSTLNTVWKNEIQNVFKNKQDIWVIGDQPNKSRFYIFNYEALDKVDLILKYLLKSKNIGIIIDECHNFRNTDAKRVIRLLSLARITKCKDVLLMSGTPIKAMGSEMVPTLDLIDPYFVDEARKEFIYTFGQNRPVALDVLKNRLGLIMHRKMKSEVLDLPEKIYEEIKIKIPNGKKYTLENVKTLCIDFLIERKKYYESRYKEDKIKFDNCLNYFDKNLKGDKNYARYRKILDILLKNGYSRERQFVDEVSWANKYEIDILRPILPKDLKKDFDEVRAAIKYINLKIMGEMLGGLLNNLRAEMFSNILKNSPICQIIKDSEKKVVCFTTYVDVVKTTDEYIRSSCHKNPLIVFGETSKNINEILEKFKKDPNANPLIATIQTLSTGVTLVEASTVIFLNEPWRHTDKLQAEDRLHRIGQESDVKIYTFILDTGKESNLSTRLQDIVSWSKEMFEGIVKSKISFSGYNIFK